MAKNRPSDDSFDDEDAVHAKSPAPAPVIAEVVQGEPDPAGEEMIWVEAVNDGQYPELEDPRYEPWYLIMRHGRRLNEDTNTFMPGAKFKMKRKDAMGALESTRGTFGWVRILAQNEEPQEIVQQRPVPATTAPRGYGQGRRPGRMF